MRLITGCTAKIEPPLKSHLSDTKSFPLAQGVDHMSKGTQFLECLSGAIHSI
jgi:hypothetical protein